VLRVQSFPDRQHFMGVPCVGYACGATVYLTVKKEQGSTDEKELVDWTKR
jgi:hypothetical protein